MLSKAATMLLGLIHEAPVNAYEITKKLQYMNITQWYNIADSTVYATIKSLEKKQLITGAVEKDGNMPDKTVYRLTDKGGKELMSTLKRSILQFDYDTNIFSIAAFFIDTFPLPEQKELLSARIDILEKYLSGIDEQIHSMQQMNVPRLSIANVQRIHHIVSAELSGAQQLLDVIS